MFVPLVVIFFKLCDNLSQLFIKSKTIYCTDPMNENEHEKLRIVMVLCWYGRNSLFKARDNRQSTSPILCSILSSDRCYEEVKVIRLLIFSN